MGKIPCRLCSNCGLYNDLSVQTCECGTDITNIPALLVDEHIPPERYGEINKLLPVFVQKCSACGAENFTADASRPVRICHNCHKARVAAVVPVPYGQEPKAPAPPAPAADAPTGQPPQVLFRPSPPVQMPGTAFASAAEEDDEDEDDGAVALWQGILEGVQSSVSSIAPPVAPPTPGPAQANRWPSGGAVDDEDEDDGAVSSWGSLLGISPAPAPAPTPGPVPAPVAPPAAGQELTLTAIRYGRLSFTLHAAQRDLPFLLGRSAGYGDFLSQDIRVSNEHCYLAFQGGGWVVIDNHSANGTAVNKRFLDYNGQQALHDGDELMLGHHPDSMAFRISIR